MNKIKIVWTLLLLVSMGTKAAVDVSFENGVPPKWQASNGELSTSSFHYKDGNSSLQWNWDAGASLNVSDLQAQGLVAAEVDGYFHNTFRMWAYNPKAEQNDSVLISFLDAQGAVQYQYYFYLNFTGWRSLAISYKYEMWGPKASQDIEQMKIEAPSTGSGTLFFESVDFTTDRITNSAPATHLPYKRSLGDNHWSRMLYYSHLPKSHQGETPTSQELEDLHRLKSDIITYMKGRAPSSSNMRNANKGFQNLNIVNNSDGTIKGKPLFGGDGNSSANITEMNDIILYFARDFIFSGNQDSRNKFMQMVRHTHDQGYHYGSVLESVHHIGYDFRQYPLAILIMKDELKKEGLWEDAYHMVCWFVALDGIWEPKAETSNMDAGNTRTIARYASCFFKPTEAEQIQYLKGLRDYIQHWAMPYAKQGEGIKTDYTGFHHNFYYPSRYVAPAYKSISWLVNKFAHTAFDVETPAKEVLKKAMLVQRLSTNSKDQPMSISGRGSPFTTLNSAALGMNYLAQSYAPIDQQLAEAVNRVDPGNHIAGFGREDYPNGFWQLNYGTMAVYRQSDWVANIKGFNNHFLGQEIYAGTSQYARYAPYGALEVLYAGGNSASGKSLNGWNWNATPGATTIFLPWNQLNANGRRDERTESTFAGALRFGKKDAYYLQNESLIEGETGLFGMNFRQSDLGPNHNPSFTFQKSVFCVDGIMICLGSGISNNDKQNSTATTLFQNAMGSTSASFVIDNTTYNTFPITKSLSSSSNHWMVDVVGTGYYIKKGAGTIRISKKNQSSPNENGNGSSSGNFVTAYIDHGTAPNNGGYDFMILPKTGAREMRALADTIQHTYTTVERSTLAHIIKYKQLEAYALFGQNSNLSNSVIQANSLECLAIVKKVGDELHCSLNKPSIVFGNDGLASSETLQITVHGFYAVKEGTGVQRTSFGNNTTVFNIEVRNAEPNDFVLQPAPRKSVALPPLHDAYLSSGKGYNNSTLRLAAGTRNGFLKFDLSPITDSITQASLRLQYTGSQAEGKIVLAMGSETNWEETNLNAENQPEILTYLDTLSATFTSPGMYQWNISDPHILVKNEVSFILIPLGQTTASFASKESTIENVLKPTLSLITQSRNVADGIGHNLSAEESLNCYPNPFTDHLNFHSSETGNLDMYDLNGKHLFSSRMTPNKKVYLQHIANFAAGIYIVRFKSSKRMFSQKLIKLETR